MAPDPHPNHTSLVPPTTIELTSQRLDSTELIAARSEIDLATSPQLARAVSAALRVACDAASTLRVLALTGLDRELKVRPSRAEALKT